MSTLLFPSISWTQNPTGLVLCSSLVKASNLKTFSTSTSTCNASDIKDWTVHESSFFQSFTVPCLLSGNLWTMMLNFLCSISTSSSFSSLMTCLIKSLSILGNSVWFSIWFWIFPYFHLKFLMEVNIWLTQSMSILQWLQVQSMLSSFPISLNNACLSLEHLNQYCFLQNSHLMDFVLPQFRSSLQSVQSI